MCVSEIRLMLIRYIMLGLLFAIAVGLPAFIAVFNFLYEKQLRKSATVVNDMKKVIRRLDLCSYWDFTFWDGE